MILKLYSSEQFQLKLRTLVVYGVCCFYLTLHAVPELFLHKIIQHTWWRSAILQFLHSCRNNGHYRRFARMRMCLQYDCRMWPTCGSLIIFAKQYKFVSFGAKLVLWVLELPVGIALAAYFHRTSLTVKLSLGIFNSQRFYCAFLFNIIQTSVIVTK